MFIESSTGLLVVSLRRAQQRAQKVVLCSHQVLLKETNACMVTVSWLHKVPHNAEKPILVNLAEIMPRRKSPL
jgi:hypothetical protein